MRVWSVPRHSINGGLKRIVEICRFPAIPLELPALMWKSRSLSARGTYPTSIVRIDEPLHLGIQGMNLSFVLCKDCSPFKPEILPVRCNFRLETPMQPEILPPGTKTYVWDIAFNDDATPTEFGQIHWFLANIDAAVVESEFENDDPTARQARTLIDARPVPGRFLLDPEELDLYQMLGEPAPFFWEFGRLFEWALERPDTTVFTTGG